VVDLPKKSAPQYEGVRARVDPAAPSESPDLPVFIARPKDAPVYFGFPILEGSEQDGFVFGVITDPKGASWGDAYVIAPDGWRAGIVWQITGDPDPLVCAPSATRWGVYAFRFDTPMDSDQDLIRNLHAVLPQLKVYYAAARTNFPT